MTSEGLEGDNDKEELPTMTQLQEPPGINLRYITFLANLQQSQIRSRFIISFETGVVLPLTHMRQLLIGFKIINYFSCYQCQCPNAPFVHT
jgi:hypothetical protein